MKTTKGYISLSEKDVAQKSQFRFQKESVFNMIDVSKRCHDASKCHVKRTNIKMTINTKARISFFLSGPEFCFVFDRFTKTTQSWVDVMARAVRSTQNTVTSENCLGYYNVHKSIFKTRNLFSKVMSSTSRMYSILIKLIQPK